MNYEYIYSQIIERAQLRASSKREANKILGYSEAHHILPKCLGGTNEKSNIVHLTAREHFIAHLLLVKIYPLEPKLLYACHRLMHDKNNNRLNGKSYAKIKEQFIQYKKSQNKENNVGIAAQSEKMKGRTKETFKYLENNGKKISNSLAGRTKETHEYIANAAIKTQSFQIIFNVKFIFNEHTAFQVEQFTPG